MLHAPCMLISVTAPARKTFADLAALGEDTHVELIHGELVPKASPSGEHQGTYNNLMAWLYRRFNRAASDRWPGGWWIRTEVHVEYESGEVHCPDALGWRRTTSPEAPRGWPVRIRPDWVCEVLSRGHEKRDRVDKMAVLERAAVPHYWLIDHEEQLIEIYRHTPDGYLLVKTATSGQVVRLEPFDAIELRTDVVFADADDDE
jgi:Uma2 family endonuclease